MVGRLTVSAQDAAVTWQPVEPFQNCDPTLEMASDCKHVFVWTEDEIEGEYRLQFRDQRYELDRGFGIHIALENEVHAIKTYIAFGQGSGRNRWLLWDPIAKDFPSGIEDSLTVGPEVIADARWGANRCCRKPLGEKDSPDQ